ncbi:hypothetical protein BOX15_Mlig018053g1 [Macrostomum lignano]|uniref:Protein kinase domain-containing protein n=1 Tax=Macrostomum lignano TaxID=282301 RepID=A0A267F8Q0_9PLAT|nr:hypothetical protein BOX15_Mlig018053g1 [Macrostomum lignano]
MTTTVHREDIAYDIGPCLGKGGFGVCYKAIERPPGDSAERVVAVKKISLRMIQQASKEPYLQYEVDIHSRLRHRNVVELYANFVYDDFIYFVLEYCNKKSLADMIVHLTCLSLDLAAYYFTQLITGLRYLHSCNILHRDLKLSNILVDVNDVIKITDFGLSCTVTRSYLERHLACGTPNYLSPEVLLRQGHTTKSDIWSCGVVLYTLFGGLPPFQMDELADIYRCIVTGSYEFTRHHTDEHLRDLVARMLHLDPEERPELDEIERHQFCSYSQQYESRLISDAKDSVGCVHLRYAASTRLFPKSLTCVLNGKGKTVATDATVSNSNGRKRFKIDSVASTSATTVIDLRLARISALLRYFRTAPAWGKLATDFGQSWLTWWRDKTSTCGFYYQLSDGYNCVLYNDATSFLQNTGTGQAYYVSGQVCTEDNSAKRSTEMPVELTRTSSGSVSRFYEPLAQDLTEELQDVPSSNLMREQVSWVSQGTGTVHYLRSWSKHCGGTYHVFHLSDESVQVNFAGSYLLRVCGSLCYFYQPARKGFVFETKSVEDWCSQDVNGELVDVLCSIFLD